ncbi:hypothetical protein BZB76_1914 [Actinomadura pelletieri DSM 43383]|uniref:Excreted virulence factor EspC (Type VII ESX diderm) n=1 Tax=Actinomadura pelletieri DSM 43383 TaxID=1120940 RepID=A0A495QSY9_9ACTN|nr:DUF6507 family protein [Actinomadura pelletieri]RKS76558.1 hypothetical protein BZB76_1914 [Actinomadura pelletieri DSM 43383]
MAIDGWNIEVAGIRAAVARTIAAIEPLEGQAKTYLDAASSAGTASGSGRINEALLGFAQHHKYTLALATKRTANCVNGVTRATNAYLRGDAEMAEAAQRNARIAPTPADLGKRK